MQYKKTFIVIFSALLLFFTGWTETGAQTKSWEFRSWDTVITVNPDSSILVEEEQAVDFRGSFSWISRTLPKTKGIWYDNLQVFDEEGIAINPEIKNSSSEVRITVPFSKTPENGITQKTFTFSYRAHNTLGDFENHDELYWNVVSSQRGVPIRYATATVTLPESFEASQLMHRLLTGPRGSTTERNNIEILDGRTLRYSTSDLGANHEMTIVAGWPNGAITFTTMEEEIGFFTRLWSWLQWIYFASPFVLLAWLIAQWRQHGRDPQGKVTIVPQYEPPDSAPPAVVGTLIDEHADQKDFTATIVDLAVRGYLRIEEDEGSGLFRRKTYTFIKLKSIVHDTVLKPYERTLLEKLFSGGERVALTELKKSFHTHMKEITSEIYRTTTEEYKYFPTRPDSVRKRYYIAAVLFFVAGFWTLFVPWAYAILLLIFGRIMPKKTEKGVHASEWAEGFKLYLHTAERFRVAAMTPQTFERFLPYAMVFGVEKQWANRFRDIYTEPPQWFHSTHAFGAFSAVAFTEHLSSVMNTNIASGLASSPSSSSGFSGGGFSGGGGGGGGSSAG